MHILSVLIFFALGQQDVEGVSRKLLQHFQSMEDLHIKGELHSSAGPFKYTSKSVFDFFKNGEKLKYFEKLVESQNETDKVKNENVHEFEYYKNESGLFNINNDPKTGQFQIGMGILFENNNDLLGFKRVYINKPLAPLTGNYAFTVVKMTQNPCYSFEELLQISKSEMKEESLEGAACHLLVLTSPWGQVKIWVDPVRFRPLKAETLLTNKSLQSTGETVEVSQKEMNYKTSNIKTTFIYTYDSKETRFQIPLQVRLLQTDSGIAGSEHHEMFDNCQINYTVVEPFSRSMNSKMVISSTAKNGTPFHLSSHPQIAYHLEEGQLVLSANHKFLNKISQTVFGSPGFWQRLTLILVPLILSTALGLFLWKRWRPQAT